MPIITFVEPSGVTHDVEVPVGWSVMEGARAETIPGIDADCGGNCACGTCHVYVEPEWQARIPATDETEAAMLDSTSNIQDNSRLACQITVTEELEGLVVYVPPYVL